MVHRPTHALATAALLAVVALGAAPAHAQRMSLAERVDRLEQQQSKPAGGNAVDLVNQISALQNQVQTLQGQVEELRHSLQESKQREKDQYVDLDSRIGRLEGGGQGMAPPRSGAPAAAPINANPPDVDLGGPQSPSASAPPAPVGGVNGLSDADRSAVAPGVADGADTGAAPVGQVDSAAENAAYDSAFSALKDGRYAESARRFQAFIDQYPNGELTGNAYYWLGESYYVTQNYKIAQQAFQTLLQRYPNSQKAPDALLKVGYTQYELKQLDQAQDTLNQVVRNYPDTTVARLAQGRLRAIQMEAHP